MCSHQEKKALDVLYQQVSLIKDQEEGKTPSQHTKIRCGCLKLTVWKYMYRCLYCSVWFCKECAEQHFGKTVEEYRVIESNKLLKEELK
jgi:hypothetical protein